MTLEEMQFASFVVMALLMLKLLTLRIRPTSSRTQDKKDGGNGVLHLVRRLMVCGTAIVALQFLLQL